MKSAIYMFLLGVTSAVMAAEEPVTFALQLVRGTDEARPAESTWRPLDPGLHAQFRPVFRWRHYWEVNRGKAKVSPGQSARVRLNLQREVEIELLNPRVAEVRVLVDGRVISKSRQPLRQNRWIIGGTRENAESWFVVVAPEKAPAVIQAHNR